MKYLKVIPSDESKYDFTKKWIAHHGKETLKSVEICEEIKQPQMIETGILMSPAEITGCDQAKTIIFQTKEVNTHNYELNKCHPSIGSRTRIDHNSVFPREFYRKDSIQTSIDWESIPVGSLVEVEPTDYCKTNNHAETLYGKFDKVTDVFGTKTFEFVGRKSCPVISIKSVRIIEEAK